MLEINKNHKKANLNKLVKPLKTIAVSLTVPAVIFVYSGSIIDSDTYALDNKAKTETEEQFGIKIESEIKEIPDSCREDIVSFCKGDKITKKEVEQIKSINFSIGKDDSLEFLKYFKSVEDLHIGFNEANSKILNTIPYLDNLKKLGISCAEGEGSLDYKANKFWDRIDKYKNLEELYVAGFSIGENTIEKRNNIKTIRIENVSNLLADVSEVKSVFDVSYNGVYNSAIFITYNKYLKLKKEKRIKFNNQKSEDEFIEITKKIDDKVEKLNITDDMSDEEKVLKIVSNNMEVFKYYPYLDVENKKGEILTASDFDKGGALYGPFEKGYGVCEAASLLNTADFNRVGIKALEVQSIDHSFLMVNVDNKVYEIDPTWLDAEDDVLTIKVPNKDKKEEQEKTAVGKDREKLLNWAIKNNIEVSWFMNDPSLKKMKELDDSGSHNYLEDLKDIKTLLLSPNNKKVKAKVGGQALNMDFVFLVATLKSLGIAIPSKNKNEILTANIEDNKSKKL